MSEPNQSNAERYLNHKSQLNQSVKRLHFIDPTGNTALFNLGCFSDRSSLSSGSSDNSLELRNKSYHPVPPPMTGGLHERRNLENMRNIKVPLSTQSNKKHLGTNSNKLGSLKSNTSNFEGKENEAGLLSSKEAVKNRFQVSVRVESGCVGAK